MSAPAERPYFSVLIEDAGLEPNRVAEAIVLNTTLTYAAARKKLAALPATLALRLERGQADALVLALAHAGANARAQESVKTRTTIRRDNTVRVSPSGSLDAHNFDILEEQLDAYLDEGLSDIRLDLAGVTYISSAAIGVIVEAARHARELGGRIRIENPSPPVREILDMLGFDTLLDNDLQPPDAQR